MLFHRPDRVLAVADPSTMDASVENLKLCAGRSIAYSERSFSGLITHCESIGDKSVAKVMMMSAVKVSVHDFHHRARG